MKRKLITYMLLLGLMLNPAYAGDGINTENDLIKAGAICIVAAPVIVPVAAIKGILQRKPDEAVTIIILAPLMPVVGAALIGSGVLLKSARRFPPTSSANLGTSTTSRSSYIPHGVYPVRSAEPDLTIDDAGLSL